MYGNIIAIGLLAMPVVALIAMACAWSPAEDDLWVRVWPTAWFPALWLAFWMPMYLLRENGTHDLNPFVFAIPLVSWLGVSLCCRLGRVRKWGLTTLLVLLGLAICVSQFMPEGWSYTGQDRDNAHVLARLGDILKRGHRDLSGLNLPAGWIDTPPRDDLWKPDQNIVRGGLNEQRIHHRVWHTWLTGLYRVTSRPAGVWYPGGKPLEAADQLEWRPR
jgi:hypothetical protein